MASTFLESQALADRWHRFSAASVRAFHRYATWLVGLSWWRFTLYAVVLLIMTGILRSLPPFSWTFTEITVDSGAPRHRVHRSASPPAPVAPVAPTRAPAPAASPAASTAVAPAAPAAPQIRITKAPPAPMPPHAPTNSIDIVVPGIVIDSKKNQTIRSGDVNITFGEDGIHITSDRPVGDSATVKAEVEAARREAEALQADAEASRLDVRAAAESDKDTAADLRDQANALREKAREKREQAADARGRAAEARADAQQRARDRAEEARQRAEDARLRAEDAKQRSDDAKVRAEVREQTQRAVAEASSAAAAAAAAVASAPLGVDVQAGGQSVHINLPPGADTADVKDAIEEARSTIVDAIKDAEDARREQVQAAKEAADEAQAAARQSAQADDGEATTDDGDRHRTRTRTVRYGEDLPALALWWILGSLLVKITYKGRIQAEAKAAVATETAEAESLRRQVLEAKMAMMQAQVEPHFLFNTLASIDHLIEFDPKRASQMQRNLISLLRASMPSMRSTDSGLRPLDLELAVVRPYLEILKVRMEERLTTEIDVPDGLLSAEFPPMMIQTLVENSIKHGLEPKAEGGHLSVKAEIRHGNLCVTVADTGLGFETAAKGATHGTGVGLSNIRERLALLYGAKANLTIANNPVGGTVVTITVPYTTHSDEGESA
jgi:hypothetical protein